MTHNGKSKYATTSLVVTKEQLTRKMDRITDQRILDAVTRKLMEYRDAVAAIEGGERVPEGLNFYYARHTWSTLAMNACGIDFDTVHQSLNHARRGADRVTGIYVEQDYTKAWEANRKVLDLLK